MLNGVLSAAWLLGLYYASPVLRTSTRYQFVDRLRDSIVLGVGIPFSLAFLHLLYAPVAWAILAILVVLGAFRARDFAKADAGVASVPQPPLITIAAIALISWPPLMRPLLEGDSTSYHLPIAASWVHSHSIWVVDPRYWWYPPASEAFAAGLFLVAGPYLVNWSGFVAILLLALRLYEWMRDLWGAPRWLADALVAATVTVFPVALQAGTLQNDVWLAAFFVDFLRTLGNVDTFASVRSAFVLALIKPFGYIFALLAAAISRARLLIWLAILIPIVLWAAHVAILWNNSVLPIWTGASTTDKWTNSLAFDGFRVLALFIKVMFRASPFAVLALCAAAVGPFLTRVKNLSLGLAGTGAVAFLLFTPLVTNDWFGKISSGETLRFAIPAIAIGALILTPVLMRVQRAAIVVLCVSALYASLSAFEIYWNDLPTLSAIVVSLLAVSIATIAPVHQRWLSPVAFAAAVISSALLIGRFPDTYYADGWRVHGESTGFYNWVARSKPLALGSWGLRLGAVNELSPSTRTVDLPDDAPCEMARRLGVQLVAMSEDDRSPSFNAARLNAARLCGKVIYHDGIAIVVDPTVPLNARKNAQ